MRVLPTLVVCIRISVGTQELAHCALLYRGSGFGHTDIDCRSCPRVFSVLILHFQAKDVGYQVAEGSAAGERAENSSQGFRVEGMRLAEGNARIKGEEKKKKKKESTKARENISLPGT